MIMLSVFDFISFMKKLVQFIARTDNKASDAQVTDTLENCA